MTEITYRTERLDHLGIVAGICDEIELVEQIDHLVPAPRRQVSLGQAVKAMIINALGFVSRPLYLTPEFFTNKPVELLIGAGITAEVLNDDSLGRALDALFEAGLTEVFA
jgi:transposase